MIRPCERGRPRCLDSQRGACSGCALNGGTKTDLPSTCRSSAPLFPSRGREGEKSPQRPFERETQTGFGDDLPAGFVAGDVVN